MKTIKDKMPKDSNGKWHGYQEWYHLNKILMLRGLYKHGLEIGYEEYHGSTWKTNFYIK